MNKKLIAPAIVTGLLILVLWITLHNFNRDVKTEAHIRADTQEFYIAETEDGKFRPMRIGSGTLGEQCIDHDGIYRGARYQDSCLFDTKEEALAAIDKYNLIFNTKYEFAKPKRIISVE